MFKKLISVYMSVYLILFVVVTIAPAYAQNDKEYTIAILNLDAKGVSEVEAEVISEKLRSHVSQILMASSYTEDEDKDHYLIVEQAQVDRIFEQFEIQNTGCVSDSCAIEFGKMLQVDRLVIGQIGLIGNTYLVSARIVDVESGKSIITADREHKGSIDDLMSTVIIEVGDELFLGLKKKSKKLWYIVGGALVIGAGAAASLSGSSDKDGDSGSTVLPLPPVRP